MIGFILIFVYILITAFFLWDVYRNVHEEEFKKLVLHYTFAIFWPIALLIGFALISIDFLKDHLE